MFIKSLRICVAATVPALFAGSAHAATISAANCSAAAVQSAVNQASNGDTILVPSGSCSWSSGVSIESKNLTIQGAGNGKTQITAAVSPLFRMSKTKTRLTGFAITANGLSNLVSVIIGNGWRIDHNTFTNTDTSGTNETCVYVRGESDNPHPVGVIDHNTFNNCRVHIVGDAGLTRGTIWSQPTGWGTNNGAFIEDNTFQYTRAAGNCVDSQYSGRYIVRFNTFVGCPIEAHSTQNGFGARSWEVYFNGFTPGNNHFMGSFMRGGTGIMFANTFDRGWEVAIRLDNVRSIRDAAQGWGACDGTQSIDGNKGSGQSYPAAGWPCRGQIGRGVDSFLFVNDSAFPPQASEPTPIFLNREGSALAEVRIANGADKHISDCRDIQIEKDGFDGSCGTGVGLAGNRPSSCTVGVYYWATNEGEWNAEHPGADGRLYKCTDRNTWSLYYTPYVYPHPLTTGSVVKSAAPVTPQNLRITQ